MNVRHCITIFVCTIFGLVLLFLPQNIFAQNILFEDDFEQDRSYQWEIKSGNWTRQYIYNSYRYGLNLNTGSTITEVQAGDFGWTNYEFSFDMLPMAGADRNVSFRVKDQSSSCCSWYIYPVSYSLHMYSDSLRLGKNTAENTSAEVFSTAITLSDRMVTHFRIRLEDNHIQVFINGNDIPIVDYIDNNNPILTGRISLLVTTGAVYPTEVWFDNILVTKISKPVPLTKTVFAPGITASWNTDALVNCNTYPTGEWVLAPYAEDVYNPILQAIKESGWELLPFYYDWRKDPRETSNKLAQFIEDQTDPGEKVNYVGHSMGGMVGKNYLDSTQDEKIASFLSVGTPYKGSALAYPPWEGAETWSNNLVEKIGVTLYLKHCSDKWSNNLDMVHSEIPSLQSLLPVDPYLLSKKDSTPKLSEKVENRNNWFNNINQGFAGIRSGNIAGTGIETTEIIQTKDPNKKDEANGLWADGVPAGKITSFDGDGTVLKDSAILDSADDKIIVEQTSHRGLVNSVEGMGKILGFLGFPENPAIDSLTASTETPRSALVIIGYPANFVIMDIKGNTKQDKDGMIAFMNPKSGSYKVKLLSKSNDTLFIVAQFLPNGEVKYKEYNFKGIGPKIKTLKFDSESPQEDILTQ